MAWRINKAANVQLLYNEFRSSRSTNISLSLRIHSLFWYHAYSTVLVQGLILLIMKFRVSSHGIQFLYMTLLGALSLTREFHLQSRYLQQTLPHELHRLILYPPEIYEPTS